MDHSLPQTSRDHPRLGVVVGVVVGAALIGLAAWALAPRAASAPGPAGPRLSISLVAPVEPALIDGGVLDVGMLNDGFDRAVLDRSPETIPTDLPPDAYVGEDLPPPDLMPEPRPVIRQTSSSQGSIITSTDPLADGSHLFGFDRRAAAQAPDVRENSAIGVAPVGHSDAFFQ